MSFTLSEIIGAPAEDLFALTQDYSVRLQWDPFLSLAQLLDGAREPAVGVRALCKDKRGRWMETVYVSYQPPRVCAVKMTRGPWIVASFAASWRFEPLSPDRTRVIFAYHLEARPRWLSRFLTPLLARRFAAEMRKRLVALKRYAERTLTVRKDATGIHHIFTPAARDPS